MATLLAALGHRADPALRAARPAGKHWAAGWGASVGLGRAQPSSHRVRA